MTTSPASGAIYVSINAPFVVTFSAAMDTTATSAQLVWGFPATTVKMTTSWSADGKTMTNTPAPAYPAFTMIGWTLSGQDAQGQPLQGNNLNGYFYTSSGTATVPQVVVTAPTNGASGVPLNTPFVATFSAAMNTTATTARLWVLGTYPPQTVTVTISWSADGETMTCAPTAPYPANAVIDWSIYGQDTQGQALQGVNLTGGFTTVAGSGNPPALVSSVPTNDAVSVSPTSPVILTFSVPMDTNITSVTFVPTTNELTSLPVTASWSTDHTILTNTPSPPFPPGDMIVWTAKGADLSGNALAPTMGNFMTAGIPISAAPLVLLSRGQTAEQSDAGSFQTSELEFIGLAANSGGGAELVLPAPASGVTLSSDGSSDALEFEDTAPDAMAFATNYPAGTYTIQLPSGLVMNTASLALDDGPLPSLPQIQNWQSPLWVALQQPLALQWTLATGGLAVDYFRLRVEQNGVVLFNTPLPGTAGALTGASNSVVVPAGLFTNTGIAEISLTAFSFTALDTNSIPGSVLRAAQHSTTTCDLSIVDPSVPPPALSVTSLTGVTAGETFLLLVPTTNGVPPLKFELAGGALPPGLALDPSGLLSGLTTNLGAFDATIRLTDLIGRSVTAPLHLVTAAIPPESVLPHVENIGLAGQSLVFDVVGGVGTGVVVEQSSDLLVWAPYQNATLATGRLTLRVPLSDPAMFLRVRSPNALPAPHPLAVVPVFNSAVDASAQLDQFGGSFSLTNNSGYVFTLAVPPGALDQAQTITMTDVAQLGGFPLDGGLCAAVKLDPDGTLFSVPVRLDITSPASLDPKTTLAFGAQQDGSEFALQMSFLTNRTVSQYLWHFSMGGIGSGSAASAQSQAQNNPPSDPSSSIGQQIASAMQGCWGNPNCTACDIQNQIVPLLIQMADQVVMPQLQQAVANDDLIVDAFFVWVQWWNECTWDAGCVPTDSGHTVPDTIQIRQRRAESLAMQAMVNGMNKSCQDCLAHKIWRINRMLELADAFTLVGGDYSSQFGQQFFSCAHRCLRFEAEFNSTIKVTDTSGDLITATKGKVKLLPISPNGDPSAWLFGMLFSGSAAWEITSMQVPPPKHPDDCPGVPKPSNGRLSFPWVKMHLYDKKLTPPPKGQAGLSKTTYTFNPNMTLFMDAMENTWPQDDVLCPADGSWVPALFGAAVFNEFHEREIAEQPPDFKGLLPEVVYRITGFSPGSEQDVLMSKDYNQTIAGSAGKAQETTTIELRHTPQQ